MFTLEPTVTYGLIFQTVSFAILFTVFLQNMKSQLGLIRNDINYLQQTQKSLTEAFTQLGTVLTKVAVQDTRINMIEKRMDELAHGEGIIGRHKG